MRPASNLFKPTGCGEMKMKKVLILVFASLFGFQMQANAMQLEGEEKATSPVYKATKSAVKKALKKMGTEFTIDSDGDIKYKMDDKGWGIYIVFSETRSGKLWNLQMLAQFSTKKSRYDELVEYANSWNAKKKYPKVSMKDRDSLRASLNYPIQYGFNPDEFEDNVVGMFERAITKIADETNDMRR